MIIGIIRNNINALLLICVLGCLPLSGLAGNDAHGSNSRQPEPVEVIQTPVYPLPAIWNQVRAGHWIHGVNWPWDTYGGDFGCNLWGYRGLANQGPSGWRREVRDNNQAAKRLFWAQRSNNDYCMGIETELKGPFDNAIVLFYLDDLAGKRTGDTVNLSGQTVTAQLYLPSGIEGPTYARSGVMLFFQDKDWTWAQIDWVNIEIVNQWITISANLDNMANHYPGFDRTQIRAVGIKLGVNSQAGAFSYNGPFYIDNVKASGAPDNPFDFNSADTRTETEMKDVANLKVKALRWWLFADGRAGLIYDSKGFVTGLDDKFINDLDEMIRLARSSRMYLVLVLFDYLMGGEPQILDNVQVYGRADLFNDPNKRKSLLDKAVSVIFDKLIQANEVVIVDLFNEPEWLLLESDIIMPAGKRPAEIKEGGIIALATMKTLFSEIIELYKQKGLERKQLLTIGSASPQWVTLWTNLDLDIAQFHLWNGAGQIDEGLKFDFPPPVSGMPNILGEYSTLPAMSLQSTADILEKAQLLGYAGAFAWGYRAKDNASLPLLGNEARNSILKFANNHPDLINISGEPVPNIKANSSDDPITILSSDRLSVTVELNAGQYAGINVDWWIIALAGSFWYYLNNSDQWTEYDWPLSNYHPVYQGGLFDLQAKIVLSITSMPVGSYTFWFAVDYPMDGILNVDRPILVDSVNVTVQ